MDVPIKGDHVTWDEAISEYTTALRAARRAPGTVRLRRHYLRGLARQAPGGPWSVTTGHLRRALAVPRWSAETQKSARATFVGFYRWAHLAGHVEVDPAVTLEPITVPPAQPRPAPESVLVRALAVADTRERLMLLLAAYAGLRCAEIAQVHSRDLVDGLLYVHGKGGKTRVVPIEHSELVEAFGRTDGYLFPSPAGGHLTPGHVTKLLSRVLPDGWTGHTLRHRFATRSYAGTRDLLAVGAVLGHSRPETTQRYVLMPSDALAAVVRAAAERTTAAATASRSPRRPA